MKNLSLNLTVEQEIYQPEPDNDVDYFEYRVQLLNHGDILDEYDSIDGFSSTGQKLNLKQVKKAIENIKKDVKNGLPSRWFNHPILT